MVSAKLSHQVPSLNRLLLRTFIGSAITVLLMMVWELFADPDPLEVGTLVFFTMLMVLCLGVQWAMYKLRIRLLLAGYPALTSVVLGLVIFYALIFARVPMLFFSVVILALVALCWHLITLK